MADISLTASMRSNLLSLQTTQSLMDVTQERLSTGKKVNSAIDNPSSYYTAQSLTNRANDLNALMDSMGQGIQTIKAADEAIKAITAFTQQAKAVANSARDEAVKYSVASTGTFVNNLATAATPPANTANFSVTVGDVELTTAVSGEVTTPATAATTLTEVVAGLNTELAASTAAGLYTIEVNAAGTSIEIKPTANFDGNKVDVSITSADDFGLKLEGSIDTKNRLAAQSRYNDILGQIDQLAKDSGYKGVNLLQENDLTVIFNEDRSSNLTIKGVKADSVGLGLTPANGWDNGNTAIDATIKTIDGAINELRTMASEFGNNYSVVQNRENFTDSLINVLEEGSDKLTLADMNEESANMLALQTRQQLAINSLSLASQAAQSVLKLF